MTRPSPLKTWFLQVRGPFLVLSLALTAIGTGTAHWRGVHRWGQAALLLLGVVLAHVAVNLFNELSDFKTRIDEHTVRTPFSGGSGLLQAGITTPRAVRAAAYGTLLVAGAIGIYFSWVSGWPILVLMAAGGLAVRFYTSHLAKWLLGELVSGLTLGSFVVVGVHYALTRTLPPAVLFLSVPPGILTSLLLFLNEFPDMEADREGGRHHLVIHFGRRKSAFIYAFSMAAVFVLIAVAPLLFALPRTVWLGLLPLPLATAAAAKALRHPDDMPLLAPAVGMNVGVVLLTDLLLAVGLFLY